MPGGWHAACSLSKDEAGVPPMKIVYRVPVAGSAKSKKAKKTAKSRSAASIAERYMEVRRLRERISEVESRLDAR